MPRVSISRNRKINLGNYESEDIFVSLAVDIEDTTTVEETMLRVKNMLDKEVSVKLKELGRTE